MRPAHGASPPLTAAASSALGAPCLTRSSSSLRRQRAQPSRRRGSVGRPGGEALRSASVRRPLRGCVIAMARRLFAGAWLRKPHHAQVGRRWAARGGRWRRFPSRRPLTGGRLQRFPRPPFPPPLAGARPRRAVGLRSAGGGAAGGAGNRCRAGAGRGARATRAAAAERCTSAGAVGQLPALGRGAARLRRIGERLPVRARSALVPAPRLCCRQYPLTAFACALSASLLPWRTRVGAERCSGRKRRGCGAAGSSAARCQPESGGTLRGLLRVFFCPLRFALTHSQFSCVSWGGKCNIYIYALLMFVTYWYIINCFLIIGLLNKCGLHPCAS